MKRRRRRRRRQSSYMASAISPLSLLSNVKCGCMFRLKSAVIKSILHFNTDDVDILSVTFDTIPSRKTSGIYLIMTNWPETCSHTPISVAARSKAWVCDRSLAANAGSNPAEGMGACLFECCVLSGRDPCVGPITRPEESYRECCVH